MIVGAAMAATIPASRRILIANVFEAVAETKQGSIAQAVRHLPPEGYAAAVLKDGPWGVLIIDAERGEDSFGAHEVPVCGTIGSGDVFAGVLAAHVAAGNDLVPATGAAAAAAAAWITSSEDQPGEDLPARASAIAAAPAVWVDRRRLEALRFAVETDPGLDPGVRERIGRGLRYLGMETVHTANDAVQPIDVRGSGNEGTDPVAAAVTKAIVWAREAYGSTRPSPHDHQQRGG